MTVRIFDIFKRALNLLDNRVVGHGERVAYIILKMYERDNMDKNELLRLCCLSMLHDIGAFKTEDADKITDSSGSMLFEYKNTHNHSVYGYLFLKNFSPMADNADAILYHHYPYKKLLNSSCKNITLASRLFVADRLDVVLKFGGSIFDEKLFYSRRGNIFSEESVDLLMELEREQAISQKLLSGDYVTELEELFKNMYLSEDETTAFLRTLAYAADFRSEYTVMHTINVVGVATELARLVGIDDIQSVFYGALLHDIGKLSTSVSLLEKTTKLDDFEFNIMKDHVSVTERILSGCIDDKIVKIASRHHEKLDGTGYPHGLRESDLSESEMLMAVADIISALAGQRSYKPAFPEDKIRQILSEQAKMGKLSPEIVSAALDNYNELMIRSEQATAESLAQYRNIVKEYDELIKIFGAD